MLSQGNGACQKNKSKGHGPAKTRTCPFIRPSTLVIGSVFNPLFGSARARKVIAENGKNEISEEKNAKSHEDADDLLTKFHGWPSRISNMSTVKSSNQYANEGQACSSREYILSYERYKRIKG
jgi:hypothetical protein